MAPPSDDYLLVVLVEDSQAFTERIGELLGEIPGVVMGGVAVTAAEAAPLIARVKPHLVLLDVFLRDGTSGIDVLKTARQSGSNASFLVFTNQPSPELQQYALSLGARFFFDKADFFEIGDAVAQLKTEKETSRIAAAAQ